MPIKRCRLPSGKRGYKWGDSGKCYISESSAKKQGVAIHASKSKQKGNK